MSNMTDNNPIEKWTRKQCEEYLKQYPKGLKSEAVRKRFEVLTPKPELPKTKEASTNGSMNEKHEKGEKEVKPTQSFESSSPNSGVKPSSAPQPSQNNSSTYVDEHEKGMAVVGKVVLSVLALAVCLGLGWGLTELFGISYGLAAKGVSVLVATPIETWIWKK